MIALSGASEPRCWTAWFLGRRLWAIWSLEGSRGSTPSGRLSHAAVGATPNSTSESSGIRALCSALSSGQPLLTGKGLGTGGAAAVGEGVALCHPERSGWFATRSISVVEGTRGCAYQNERGGAFRQRVPEGNSLQRPLGAPAASGSFDSILSFAQRTTNLAQEDSAMLRKGWHERA